MTTLAPQVFGADEINAVVLDPGSYSTRCGYAGYDSPSCILPAYYKDVDGRHVFDENSMYIPPQRDAKINGLVKDDIVVDWDGAVEQFDYMFKQLDVEPSEQPLLLTESTMNSFKNKAAALETFLETEQFCAFYAVKQPTCVSFAHGRPNCLVLDVGHDIVTATPVIDGICLKKQVRGTHYGGAFVDQQLRQYLASLGVAYHGGFEVKSKNPVYVEAGAADNVKPDYVVRGFDYEVDPSIRDFAYRRTLMEMKETLLECSMEGDSSAAAAGGAAAGGAAAGSAEQGGGGGDDEDDEEVYFELPDGVNVPFKKSLRVKLANSLFNPLEVEQPVEGYPVKGEDGNIIDKVGTSNDTTSKEYVPLRRSKKSEESKSAAALAAKEKFKQEVSKRGLGLSRLVQSVLDRLDVDLRPQLANNIVLTGATSLIPRLNERLHSELTARNPSIKVRIHSVGNTTERKYSSWVGGSILASLGTFHQLWVSRAEYAEEGPERLVINRFR